MTFTGIGRVTGTITKTVKIKPINAAKEFEVTVSDATYCKGGVKPEVTVTYGGKVLVLGTDYTVTYKNNKKAASSTDKKAPYVVVKAKGNYKGTANKAFFNISKASVAELKMQVKDVNYNAKGSNGYFLAKPSFADKGKKVTVGKGKDIKAVYTYTYAEETTLKNGTVKAEGETVSPKDKLSEPTSIKVTAEIEAGSAKSSYEGKTTLEYVYHVVKK